MEFEARLGRLPASAVRLLFGFRLGLEARLPHQPVLRAPRHAWHGRGAVRQVVDRPHSLPNQLRALVEAHAGDQDQVAVLLHLGLADRAAAAAGVAEVSPSQFLGLAHPLGDDPLEFGPLPAVHRGDVGEVVRGGRAVAEDQVDLLAGGNPVRLQSVGVGGELQERADLGVAGELGVVDLVLAAVVADDEVREADEARVLGGRGSWKVGW